MPHPFNFRFVNFLKNGDFSRTKVQLLASKTTTFGA